jgi:DNA ligase (NAD+)
MNDIELLAKELKEAREAYYNLTPILSDLDYDAKKERLKQLDPKNEEVIIVGAAPPKYSVWEKVKHEIPMGSLDKVNSLEEFEKFANNIGINHNWVITHKIDGSSMELVYKKGKLIQCSTRGDGIQGEEVSENIRQVPSVPHTLPVEIDVVIRGEIVMLKEVFENIYAEQYANPRNTAAAKVREKKGGGADCQNLEFIAYWMKSPTQQPKTMSGVFNWLKTHGFKIPESVTTGDLDTICKAHNEINNNRDKIPYEIDGTVISLNDLDLLEELGDLNMRPKGQIAWKFENSTVETNVVDIKWQVGHSGRLCPVCVVEPVGIEGVTVTNISLHNLSMFKDLNLFKGCRVLISRRNSIIPYVEKNLDQEIAT